LGRSYQSSIAFFDDVREAYAVFSISFAFSLPAFHRDSASFQPEFEFRFEAQSTCAFFCAYARRQAQRKCKLNGPVASDEWGSPARALEQSRAKA
jgi:hypothetical protein